MSARRHRWGGGLKQPCLNRGCRWWRTPKDGRHGMRTTAMLYANDEGAVWTPGDEDFKPGKAPPCEGRP